MNNTQYRPKSYVDTNYLSPPVEVEIEKSNGPSPPTHSAWRTKFRKYGPFALHFALTALVAMVCLRSLDGSAFNTNSRRPQYLEADGSVSHLTSYAPLQSDVTTAVSLAATITRVAGGWWATGTILRCIFVAMERGGISSKGLSQAISNWPPAPHHFTRKSNILIIYITLFATFSLDYFSAALTGSIVWEAADRLIPGTVPVTNITKGTSGGNLTGYFTYSFTRDWIMEAGTASANMAWGALQSNTILNIIEPCRVFRRVVRGAQHIPTNSTLANVTMPYFAVDAFEWVPEPHQVLTNEQLPLFVNYSKFGPYFSFMGIGGLLPDRKWGPPHIRLLGDPQIMSETRLLTFRVGRKWTDNSSWPCPQNYTVDPGFQVNLHKTRFSEEGYTDCFAIANVTYRAGAIMCQNCKLISPTVLEAQAPFSEIIGDPLTSMALGLAPSLGTNLFYSDYAIPLNYVTNRAFAIEMASRGYQAAWAGFADVLATKWDNTTVQIALPTLRAKVIHWRVYLWIALHVWVMLLGFLFIYIQSQCDHPWVEDTIMAIFLLETRAVLTKQDGQPGVVSDPWQPEMEICNDGMLILELDEAGQRSVQVNRGSDTLSQRKTPRYTVLGEKRDQSSESLSGSGDNASWSRTSLGAFEDRGKDEARSTGAVEE